MKTVSITLSERRAADVDAALASGDVASVSDLVEAALDIFLASKQAPDLERLAADIDEFEEGCARGEQPIPGDEAFDGILSASRRRRCGAC
jgi:Arc/MetJ-type ribon-helix-helix transcriptional regulator